MSGYGLRLIQKSWDAVGGLEAERHSEAWQVFDKAGQRRLAPEELPLTRAARQGEVVEGEELTLKLPDGTFLPILCNAGPIRDAEGRIIGGVIAWRDIRKRRQAEELRDLLMREVDHRAKNVLALVQSLVRLTTRDDPDSFVKTVEARIAALSRAHGLLSRDRWSGAALEEIVRQETAAYDPGGQVKLRGPSLRVVANAVQPLSMLLHELVTNAVKYGALSRPDGQVTLAWERRPDGAARILWTERGGPPIEAPPARLGFGSTLLDAVAADQLDGLL
ncbi:MAG TPA: HWE histidine kinase domain-containing protein, partial [Acetobacteraceae bacterium]|nr:HWE histidine kinase domain-containing protein [Acetobacteraceae bacterium]